MPKFTFICEDEPMPFSAGSITKRTIEFEAVSIDEVVTEFELFLRGAGFNPSGVLSFNDENYYNEPVCESEYLVKEDVITNSDYYFDTERNK